MADAVVDWKSLESLASRLEKPGISPASIAAAEWEKVDHAITTALDSKDWRALVRLRLLFGFLLARDTVTGNEIIQRLEKASIEAAKSLNDKSYLADFLGARGHNLHRQGYHQESIESFERAEALYEDIGDSFGALKSYYMTSLCLRALGRRDEAIEVLNNVLSRVEPDNIWKGNPLQVKAWLLQDVGKLAEAEESLKQALSLQEQIEGGEILVAGTLADLAEVVGLQGRIEEARQHFTRSLMILQQFQGQYQRQEARTKLKLAELLIREKDYDQVQRLLNEADDAIRSAGGYYDLLWRIELARSYVLFRTGKIADAIRKFRIVLILRRALSLPNSLLVKQLINRFWNRSGLPR